MLHIYCRVSTAEQSADHKTSLQEQENIGMMYAQSQGLSKFDVQVYVDSGVSGSCKMKTRPAGEKLLAAIQEGDTVIAAKMDRIFRSSIDALQTIEFLKAKGVHLILFDMGTQSVMRDGPSKLFFSMLAAFAEFERGRIVERITLGKYFKMKKGGYVGGNAPYGMRKVGQGQHSMLEPDPEQLRIFGLIKERLDIRPHDFFSPRLTAQEFAKMGIVNPKGKPYKSNHIARMAEIVKAQSVPEQRPN
jgi:DNA invertase Pin-like site-specific DNA recombinase